ncbi:MAG: tetratricopeptide repeat protein [Oligoflexales bacterium]|nr:tetratricopeptide repeat protein [Oligoflexales bacterium]
MVSSLRNLNLSLIVVLSLFSSFGLAQKNQGQQIKLEPTLPLPTNTFGFSPYIKQRALAGSAIYGREYDANQEASLTYEVELLLKEYTHSPKERKNELTRELYREYQGLCALIASNPEADSAKQNKLRTCYGNLVTFANRMMQLKGISKNQKAELAFNILLAKFHSEPSQRSSVLAQLRQLSGKSALNSQLKKQAVLLIAFHDIQHGQAKNRAQAAHSLAKVMNSLSGESAIFAKMSLAYYFAGVNENGRKTGQSSSKYRAFVAAVVKNLNTLPSAEAERLLAQSISLWTKVEGRKINWNKAPFSMAVISDHPYAAAIKERAAIADYNTRQYDRSVQKYRELANEQNEAQIQEKIILIRKSQYLQSSRFAQFENELTALRANCNENGQNAVCQRANKEHLYLVDRELAKADRQKSARRNSIDLTTRFLAIEADKATREVIAFKLANLYAKEAQHAQAVSIYEELAKNGVESMRPRYLKSAIESQHVLAAWPKKVVFSNQFKDGPLSERQKLLEFYQLSAAQMKDRIEWYSLAQQGLLMSALGQREEGFGLWRKALETNFQENYALQACGFMLQSYKNDGTWDKLAELTKFSLARGIRPIYAGKSVDLNQLLALALFEGGKKSIADGKFKEAVAMLEDFIESFSRNARNPEAHYLLSSAYQGTGEHQKAVRILMTLAETFPRSEFYRPALLKGGKLSMQMALEESAIYFNAHFVSAFPNDAEALGIAKKLETLYIGRNLYAQAIAVHKSIAKMPAASAEEREAAKVAQLILVSKYGSVEQSIVDALAFVKRSDTSATSKAIAYAILNKHYYKNNMIKELKSVEQQLSSLGTAEVEVNYSTSEARFFLAESIKNDYEEEIFSPSLTDPIKTLNGFRSVGSHLEAAYQNVCEVPNSAYCAPAKYQLARRFEKYVALVSQITIADTLAKSEIDKFNALKNQIINDLTQKTMQIDEQAIAEVKQGYSHPAWTSQILWYSSSDETEQFDGVEGSLAYVEWDAVLAK